MKRQNGVNHSGTKKSKAYSLRKRSGSVSGRKRRLVCSILAALMLMAGIGMPRTFAADEIVYPTVNNDLEGAGGEVVYDISPVNQGRHEYCHWGKCHRLCGRRYSGIHYVLWRDANRD